MATDKDFTFKGGDQDKHLHALHEAIPGFSNGDAVHLVAGLVFLDSQTGVHSEDNYLAMIPSFAMWLLMETELLDPELSALVARLQEDAENEEILTQLDTICASRSFEISFTLEDMEYPEIIAGKTIHVRLMNPEETERSGLWCFTATPDGKVVQLPRPIDEFQF